MNSIYPSIVYFFDKLCFKINNNILLLFILQFWSNQEKNASFLTWGSCCILMCEGSRTHEGYYTDRQLLSYIPEMREPHHVHMTLGMHNSASSVGYTSSTSSQNLPVMPLAILAGFVRSDSVISECHFFSLKNSQARKPFMLLWQPAAVSHHVLCFRITA